MFLVGSSHMAKKSGRRTILCYDIHETITDVENLRCSLKILGLICREKIYMVHVISND